jgi:hypothetical protein
MLIPFELGGAAENGKTVLAIQRKEPTAAGLCGNPLGRDGEWYLAFG